MSGWPKGWASAEICPEGAMQAYDNRVWVFTRVGFVTKPIRNILSDKEPIDYITTWNKFGLDKTGLHG